MVFCAAGGHGGSAPTDSYGGQHGMLPLREGVNPPLPLSFLRTERQFRIPLPDYWLLTTASRPHNDDVQLAPMGILHRMFHIAPLPVINGNHMRRLIYHKSTALQQAARRIAGPQHHGFVGPKQRGAAAAAVAFAEARRLPRVGDHGDQPKRVGGVRALEIEHQLRSPKLRAGGQAAKERRDAFGAHGLNFEGEPEFQPRGGGGGLVAGEGEAGWGEGEEGAGVLSIHFIT